MTIGAYFHPVSMSKAQYDDITRRLDQAGAGMPRGRMFHSAFEEGEGIAVYDVWDSQESLDTFFQTLGPILQQLGVDPGQPSIATMHNIIWGER